MEIPQNRRRDPDRREKILDATLQSIAEVGIAGTTHRRIASIAGVPLGSMTYYFDGMEALLVETFTRFAITMSEQYSRMLEEAQTPQQACDALVNVILDHPWSSSENLPVSYELYAFSTRYPELRPVMHDWIKRSQSALRQHFDEPVACVLDALVEGLGIHRSVGAVNITRPQLTEIIYRITGTMAASEGAKS